MIEALNQMCLSAACVGNHDLDLGEPNLEKWIERSNFPWLCSNCWHKETGAHRASRPAASSPLGALPCALDP